MAPFLGEGNAAGLDSEKTAPMWLWGSEPVEQRGGFIRAMLLAKSASHLSRKKASDLSTLRQAPTP